MFHIVKINALNNFRAAFKFTTDCAVENVVFSDGKKIANVLVIGGGVIGLSLARELKKKGAGIVALLERGQLGQEASFAAAGMLAPQTDAERRDDFFDLCYESRGLYEDLVDELKTETGIDIELETSGTLSVSFSEADSARLEKIYNWQSAAGLPIEKLTANELLRLEPFLSPDVRGGLFFPRDAQIENRLLVKALARSNREMGVDLFEDTPVETLLTENGKIIGAATAAGKFFAPVVVLATGAWSSFIKTDGGKPLIQIAPVRGQMLSFHPGEQLFKRVIVSADGYVVPRADNRLLAGATVENVGFDRTVTPEGIKFVLKSAYKIAPGLEKCEIAEKWAGLRPCSTDNLPVLGDYRGIEGLFVATAHYRNGVLLAPITAKIMSELILEGKISRFLDAFSHKRFANALAA